MGNKSQSINRHRYAAVKRLIPSKAKPLEELDCETERDESTIDQNEISEVIIASHYNG
jgi:hypothetical protein